MSDKISLRRTGFEITIPTQKTSSAPFRAVPVDPRTNAFVPASVSTSSLAVKEINTFELGKTGVPVAPERAYVDAMVAYPRVTFALNEADVIYDMKCFGAMEELVTKAQTSIRADFYIFGGPTADRIADTLIAKHKAGLDVRVMVDKSLGTLPEMKKQCAPVMKKLEDAGVPIQFYSARAIPPYLKNGTIDHNKYFVIDGKEALLGSMNMAKKFYKYHDLMVHLAGPVAVDIATQFDHDWYLASHPEAPTPGIEAHAPPFNPGELPDPSGPGLVRLVGTGVGRQTSRESLMALIDAAKTSIHVQMHQFDSPEIVTALAAARDRGVEVKVLLDPGDMSRFVPIIHIGPKGVLNADSRKRMMDAALDVRLYHTTDESTTNHMKVMIVDGNKLHAGSTNWALGGFEYVAESNVEIYGGRAPGQAEEMFLKDWAGSDPAPAPTRFALFANHVYDKISTPKKAKE